MENLLDSILARGNIERAMQQVIRNRGAAGVDGVEVEDLKEYMSKNWAGIEQAIRERRYKPQPVKRVEIPKENGGIRKLGIPTVVDRTIEQAIAQVEVTAADRILTLITCDRSYAAADGRLIVLAVEQ